MKKFRILYVEDSRTDFEMVKAILEEKELVEIMFRVETKKEFLALLEKENINLILTDYSLPVFHGLEVIQIAGSKYPHIPVIMVTGNLSDEIAVEVIQKGAWDYVLKENIYRLIPVIESCIKRLREMKEKEYALKTLKESENNYRILAESAPYGILVHAAGKVLYHNRKAAKIFTGNEEGNFLEGFIWEFVRPDHRTEFLKRIEMMYSGESPGSQEELIMNVRGEERVLEVASSLINYKGQPAVQAVFNDIAERKEAERELLMAKERAEESDRLKTSFLENMSHEVRTPLNAIIGFTSLLKSQDITEDEKLNYIRIISESGNHLINIIEDIIEVSKIETNQFELKREVFNVNEVLEELYQSYNENEKYRAFPVVLSYTCPLSENEAFIYSDKSRLKQLVNNLLSNAFKFTDEGKIEYGYEITGMGDFRFFVRDTGTGIPESSRDIVFERFRQADNSVTRTAGGNGIGLTISRGIVHAMKGRIWLESEVGRGTDVFFEIPFERALDPLPEKTVFSKNPSGNELKNKTVLIAEDEISNFQLLKYIFMPTGMKLEHARNGKEVLTKMLNRENEIDLILMDIKMPEMNGLEAVISLRKNNIHLPVIAQTAHIMTDDEKKCLDAGCNDYVTKPINPDDLLRKVKKYLVS